MQQFFKASFIVGCLVLFLATSGLFGQLVEFSLDDFPTAPLMGPFVPPFGSAEDEFGIFGTSMGPSPSLGAFGFFDSDVLFPGPALSMTFPPPPFYADAYSVNHDPFIPPPPAVPAGMLYFSVDRLSVGIPAAAGAADILGSGFGGINGVVIPGGAAPPVGLGLPFAMPNPPPGPGISDNVDGFNLIGFPMMNSDTYFALNPASSALLGPPPGDIFWCPPGGLVWPTPVFAAAPQLGLTPNDSVDALVVWDFPPYGVCNPGVDIALFSLDPSSAQVLNGVVGAADILMTNFTNVFWVYAPAASIGLLPTDNVDGLDGVPTVEFSLDDFPAGFGSAEDEFGILGASLGPSPSLGVFGFFDSDVLFPGPVLSMTFPPPPFYGDAYSANHDPFFPPPPIRQLHFSVDRLSMGIPAGTGAADILGSNFGGVNWLVIPGAALGLSAMANVPPGAGISDSVDGYNEFVFPMMGTDIYFALHPASAFPWGFLPGDIFWCPPGGLIWPTPAFAFAPQLGLTPNDSVDALVVWDFPPVGVCNPGVDIALFSLDPSSVQVMGGFVSAADILITNFTGLFWVYAPAASIGLLPTDNVDGMDGQ